MTTWHYDVAMNKKYIPHKFVVNLFGTRYKPVQVNYTDVIDDNKVTKYYLHYITIITKYSKLGDPTSTCLSFPEAYSMLDWLASSWCFPAKRGQPGQKACGRDQWCLPACRWIPPSLRLGMQGWTAPAFSCPPSVFGSASTVTTSPTWKIVVIKGVGSMR